MNEDHEAGYGFGFTDGMCWAMANPDLAGILVDLAQAENTEQWNNALGSLVEQATEIFVRHGGADHQIQEIAALTFLVDKFAN